MKTIKYILYASVHIASSTIMAQNIKEAVQDHNQIKIDKELLSRDIAELETFKSQTSNYKINPANKPQLINNMEREIEQTKAKLARANVEVVQSTREVGTDRREKRKNRRKYEGSTDDLKDMTRDRVNTRDDKRDKRDDERDLSELQNRLENQIILLGSFKSSNTTQITVLEKFMLTMSADINETKEELAEDKGEVREDRRERRDDRRERRENL
tara:strand:- start:7600 stop:8241 length:642 start_codon:yes stop_codon:yes gene_type:complete